MTRTPAPPETLSTAAARASALVPSRPSSVPPTATMRTAPALTWPATSAAPSASARLCEIRTIPTATCSLMALSSSLFDDAERLTLLDERRGRAGDPVGGPGGPDPARARFRQPDAGSDRARRPARPGQAHRARPAADPRAERAGQPGRGYRPLLAGPAGPAARQRLPRGIGAAVPVDAARWCFGQAGERGRLGDRPRRRRRDGRAPRVPSGRRGADP